MIHCENILDVYSKPKMALWLVSAFKAGFLNSTGFLITGKFISHITGFGTQIGIAIGHSTYFFGLELLIIPISFIAGGVITSLILEGNEGSQKIPPYHYVQAIITILIAILIFFGEYGFIKPTISFNSDLKYNIIEFVIIGILCLICGLKNSLVTWSTFGKIRVTHLTGISTDIGLNLIAMFKQRKAGSRFKEQKRINFHRISTVVSFSLGAFLAAIIYPKIGHQSFFIIFFISLCMTLVSFYSRR